MGSFDVRDQMTVMPMTLMATFQHCLDSDIFWILVLQELIIILVIIIEFL